MVELRQQFGDIDIYLFDQILRGRIERGMRILDAGCGNGRNLVYLLQAGWDVYGVDIDPQAVAYVQEVASGRQPASHFQVAAVEAMPFPDSWADVVISSAVLHFADSQQHFQGMLDGMWRVLKPGGLLFCRLASSIGIESEVIPIDGRKCLLPDGSVRFLADAPMLEALTEKLGGELADPLKTTVVQHQRAMTTWVVCKTSGR